MPASPPSPAVRPRRHPFYEHIVGQDGPLLVCPGEIVDDVFVFTVPQSSKPSRFRRRLLELMVDKPEWNKTKLATLHHGRPWHFVDLIASRTLSAAAAGRCLFNERDAVPHAWPGNLGQVLTPETGAAIEARLSEPDRSFNPGLFGASAAQAQVPRGALRRLPAGAAPAAPGALAETEKHATACDEPGLRAMKAPERAARWCSVARAGGQLVGNCGCT